MKTKLIAAIALAAATLAGSASAATVTKIVKTHAAPAKSTTIVHKAKRLHVGMPILKRVKIVHRGPVVGVRKVVRVSKSPFAQKFALAHRLVVRKTIIR